MVGDLQTSGAWALVVFLPIILERTCQRLEPAYLFENIPTRHGGWPDRENLVVVSKVMTEKVYLDSVPAASLDGRQAVEEGCAFPRASCLSR
jgi:hypothetical protein